MNYETKTSPLDLFPAIQKSLRDGTQHHFYIGLDAELASCAVAVIIDGATPVYFGKHCREIIADLSAELIAGGHFVAAVQESCGFGYQFHRELKAIGVESIVVAPEELNGKRKTDKADSHKMSIDLFSYLSLGNRKALRPIRVPSAAEEQHRALDREADQVMNLRNQLAAHGRSLAVECGWREVPSNWWGVRNWPKWSACLSEAGQDWLVQRLTPKIDVLRSWDAQIKQLREMVLEEAFQKRLASEQAAQAAEEGEQAEQIEEPVMERDQFKAELLSTQPKGIGVATRLSLGAEICDWSRFGNRAQVSSYTGMCPREYSSGNHQRLGAIDRRGNAKIRTILIEAAWRMVRYQPAWRGLKKFGEVLKKDSKASKTLRRKAIVAVARLLAIDLWRLETAQCRLEDLGFTPASPVSA